MAGDVTQKAPEFGAPMDYAQHEKTYESFLVLAKLGILVTIDTVLSLVIYSFGGVAGFWLGSIHLILSCIALGLGLAMKGTAKPLAAMLVLGIILIILTAG
ncbi:aa3 type cytochrome c oxidase subunit IV [Faunimonas pinastri]|uniref:Aa3 type cytochrome c oxidase subunit IV n=1 Tax=Faunimonas pinastri TaxID=1855383 RepID=A0A1H8Z2Z9_9HYPH|nr:aa3-type cytochrome c oxidase subunit IV [Faunimonas pinastri]SEP58814.1 aa3 type cytochrome c oxidase subunit IV [Faunimonas pinastri]